MCGCFPLKRLQGTLRSDNCVSNNISVLWRYSDTFFSHLLFIEACDFIFGGGWTIKRVYNIHWNEFAAEEARPDGTGTRTNRWPDWSVTREAQVIYPFRQCVLHCVSNIWLRYCHQSVNRNHSFIFDGNMHCATYDFIIFDGKKSTVQQFKLLMNMTVKETA